MWIQVRSIDGKSCHRIDGLSKLTKIEDLREKLIELFDAPTHRQRLFYRGKQLEDGHSLFDYNVGLNEIVQLMVKPEILDEQPTKKEEEKETEEKTNEEPTTSDKENEEPIEDMDTQDSGYDDATYQIGDVIDCRDNSIGAWFEAKITEIKRNKKPWDLENKRSKVEDDVVFDDGFTYLIVYERYEEDEPVPMPVRNLRPRARVNIPLSEVETGDKVMVNYNVETNDRRGYWYDAIVSAKQGKRSAMVLKATVFVGEDLVALDDCTILFTKEIFAIEKAGSQIREGDGNVEKRTDAAQCDACNDNPKKKCKECGCWYCAKKTDPEKTLMCDECNMPYHIYCLKPPLKEIPDVDEWFCPECKNDTSEVVQAGEKLKNSKKKSKMASATTTSSRDWGKGMACVGRSSECNIVPKNHFGKVPGIKVGMLWKFRVQVSEDGAHRPHVAGIHGQANHGAYSIVLSGGYEDDHDDGETFTYTGSGGRDLSGNKRTAEQSCDQVLTRMNMALARNCNAKIDAKNGAEATDWKAGKPVRVVRNVKGGKHSEYAPEEGNRYDGIYKVVKYWPEKGKSGFIVWRYMLKRDDDEPAPWTKEGKKVAEREGFTMRYPPGYQEKMAEKEAAAAAAKGEKKRKRDSDSDEDNENADPNPNVQRPAKKKPVKYELDKDVANLIAKDEFNSKMWEEAAEHLEEGSVKYIAHVQEEFSCICCQEIVFQPVTTECKHNICKPCLQRSFKAEVYNCPTCRFDLGKDYSIKTNQTLSKILNKLFPGYEAGR